MCGGGEMNKTGGRRERKTQKEKRSRNRKTRGRNDRDIQGRQRRNTDRTTGSKGGIGVRRQKYTKELWQMRLMNTVNLMQTT